jgi:hypothetical protein
MTVSPQHLSQVFFFEMREICDSDLYALKNVYNIFDVLFFRGISLFNGKI